MRYISKTKQRIFIKRIIEYLKATATHIEEADPKTYWTTYTIPTVLGDLIVHAPEEESRTYALAVFARFKEVPRPTDEQRQLLHFPLNEYSGKYNYITALNDITPEEGADAYIKGLEALKKKGINE